MPTAIDISAVLTGVGIGGFAVTIFALYYSILPNRQNASITNFKETRRTIRSRRSDFVSPAYQFYERGTSQYTKLESKIGANQTYAVEVLCKEGWCPASALPLESARLRPVGIEDISNRDEPTAFEHLKRESNGFWPYRTLVRRYSEYTKAIEDHDRPRLFDPRDSYRVVKVEPDGQGQAGNSQIFLTFRVGKYFDHLDTEEPLTFEMARMYMDALSPDDWMKRMRKKAKYRRAIGEPAEFGNRCAAAGVNTLTIFERDSRFRFIMHFRDAGSVAIAGNQAHVVPAGEFQPAAAPGEREEFRRSIIKRDFDLWRNMVREYAEELLGVDEVLGPDEYMDKTPYKEIDEGRRKGEVVPYFLGYILEPVSLKPEILTACVFKGDSFQRIFKDVKPSDEEGKLMLGRDNLGFEFNEQEVYQFLTYTDYHTTPAGKACLALAWKSRGILTG